MATTFFGQFLAPQSVSQAAIKLENDQYLQGRNNADTADLDLIKVNASDQAELGILPVYNGGITGATPNEALVTKEYVLNVLAGQRDPKDAVRVASIGNVAIATAPAAIDGVTLNPGDRVLLKDQTLPAENGIYDFPAGGAGNPLVRSTDADEDSEVTQGTSTLVAEGTVNARRQYMVSTPDPIVVGTTALTWVRIPNPADLLIPLNEVLNLNATDLDVNGFVDLANQAIAESVQVVPIGGPTQIPGVDYTLSVPTTVTRIDFGTSGTPGSLGELLKVIFDAVGSTGLIVYYSRLAN